MPKANRASLILAVKNLLRYIKKHISMIALFGTPLLIVVIVLMSATFNMYRYYLLAAPEMSIFDVAFRLAAISYNSPRMAWNSLLVSLDNEEYSAYVRRHINWNNWQPDLREDLAHLVNNIKRRVCGIASAGFPSF